MQKAPPTMSIGTGVSMTLWGVYLLAFAYAMGLTSILLWGCSLLGLFSLLCGASHIGAGIDVMVRKRNE